MNKALISSSLASVLLHGAVMTGLPFNRGVELAQDGGNVRLNIQLNKAELILQPAQASSPAAEEPELPHRDKMAKTIPEAKPQPLVSSNKPVKAKAKKVKTDTPAKPSDIEAVQETPVESESSASKSSQISEDTLKEHIQMPAQASAAPSKTANSIDPVQLWLSELQQRINQYRRYPRQAIKRGLEGDVRIKAIINPDGSLAFSEVLSGHRSFHSASIKSLNQALPFPPPAGTSEPVTMVFTIHYKLE